VNKKNLIAALSLTLALGANAQKLTPQTVAFLQNKKATATTEQTTLRKKTLKVADSSSETFKAFITLKDAESAKVLENYGVKVMTSWDNYVTATIPVSAVNDLIELDEIENIAIGNKVTPLLDQARAWTYAEDVLQNTNNALPQAYTGKGVIVGVIDTGLEYNHRAFRNNSDTELRIKRVWDQNKTGAAPAGYDYGAEYTNADAIRNAKYDNSDGYHATHVIGIAAGAQISGSSYNGMAPDSEIVFVSMGDNGEDVDIVNGVKYIFDYAKSVGKPCVINMSLGTHQGPHDGSSVLDKFFATQVGEGRLLVGACGNEGSGAQHAYKEFTADDNTFITALGYSSSSPANTGIEIVGSKNAGENLKIRVAVVDIAKRGKIVAQSQDYTCSSKNLLGDAALVKTFTYSETGTDGYFYIYPGVDGDRPCFYIESYCTKLDANRKLAIIAEGVDGDEVHAWNLTGYNFIQPSNATSFTAGDNLFTVGEIGGVSPDVISVGSMNSRNYFPVYWGVEDAMYGVAAEQTLGIASYFSSKGPTLDRRIKPDVSAPGYLLISSVNTYYGQSSSYWPGKASENQDPNATGRVQDKNGNYYYYSFDAGTSMASPCVAGIIAQWLEADPTLTTERVLDILANTCNHSEKLEYPNNTYGYGVIDAYNGVKYLLNTAGIETNNIAADSDIKVWADKASASIYCAVNGNATVNVYSVSGAAVGSYSIDGNESIDASQWQHGVYVVTVKTANATKTEKVIL
jgi:hypothetical protein